MSSLRRRILVGPTSRNITSSWQAPRPAVLRPIHQAFFEQRALQLTYVTGGVRTERLVEPHYLLLSWPAWYLVVWDHLRQAVRALRVDRVEAATVTDATFRVRRADSMLTAPGDVFSAL